MCSDCTDVLSEIILLKGEVSKVFDMMFLSADSVNRCGSEGVGEGWREYVDETLSISPGMEDRGRRVFQSFPLGWSCNTREVFMMLQCYGFEDGFVSCRQLASWIGTEEAEVERSCVALEGEEYLERCLGGGKWRMR